MYLGRQIATFVREQNSLVVVQIVINLIELLLYEEFHNISQLLLLFHHMKRIVLLDCLFSFLILNHLAFVKSCNILIVYFHFQLSLQFFEIISFVYNVVADCRACLVVESNLPKAG